MTVLAIAEIRLRLDVRGAGGYSAIGVHHGVEDVVHASVVLATSVSATTALVHDCIWFVNMDAEITEEGSDEPLLALLLSSLERPIPAETVMERA